MHKGAEKSFDISADLDELARTPVIVVSAGAKAILDIEKTLEVLETRGVPVVAYRSDVMPAFWSRTSPLQGAAQARRGGRHRALLSRRGGRSASTAACWSPIRSEAKDEIAAEAMAVHIAAAQAAGGERRHLAARR